MSAVLPFSSRYSYGVRTNGCLGGIWAEAISRFVERMLLLATAISFTFSSSIQAETIYVGELNRIVTISSAGVQNNFAGPTTALNSVYGMAFDKSGNLYAANYGLSTIEKYNPAGLGSVYATGLSNPAGMAFDASGNLYVANSNNNTIYEYDTSGHRTIFASTPNQLNQPFGLAFDHEGNLYVSNRAGNYIEKYTPGGVGSVFANTLMSHPIGLAFDAAGNLYVANEGNSKITEYNAAGIGRTFATASNPFGLVFDASGNLFVSNESGNTIERFDSSGAGTIYYHSSTNFSPYAIALAPSVATVPEPTSLALLCIGGIGAVLGACRRRNHRSMTDRFRIQAALSSPLNKRCRPARRRSFLACDNSASTG